MISTLACARIGAVHSIVFGGYSAESLASRILDAKAKVLVTADGVWRGNKLIHLLGLYRVPHNKIFISKWRKMLENKVFLCENIVLFSRPLDV